MDPCLLRNSPIAPFPESGSARSGVYTEGLGGVAPIRILEMDNFGHSLAGLKPAPTQH